MKSGFTLLEVLLALAILSGVSLVVIRAVGDGMVQIGDSAWKDLGCQTRRIRIIKLIAREWQNGAARHICPGLS